MITGAAFVPSTPMLVPAVASGAADELADVRDASITALRRVLGSRAQRIVVLGAGTGDPDALLRHGFAARVRRRHRHSARPRCARR